MQLRFPISWHFTGRARGRLIFRMPTRRSKLFPTDHFLGLVVIKPGLPWLETRCDGMPGHMKVFGCVLAGGTVAAAHMAALCAASQVEPPTTTCKAFSAAVTARWNHGIDSLSIGFHLYLQAHFEVAHPWIPELCVAATLSGDVRLVIKVPSHTS